MKKPTLAIACSAVLLLVLVTSVHASSVSVKSTIGDNIYLIYSFENLDPTIYYEAIANEQLFNSSAIPKIIVQNLDTQNLKRVNYGFQPNTYDNATQTIRVSFYLGGSDIISYNINRTTMKRTYQVKTEWRKFQVSLTSNFSINFAEYFREPVENWRTNYTNPEGSIYPAFYYETTGTTFFDKLSFYFILPATATNIQVEIDTITYEVSPYLEDVFLNSPFLILTALIVVIAIVLVYRRVK